MAKTDNLTDFLTDVANAIREKKGITEPINPQNFSDEIASIKCGSDELIEKDVNFYDYDGTLLYAYTIEEAQALTELPQLPTQDGLICQEWNWTLEDIKSKNDKCDIGATYITDDGKTRVYIRNVSSSGFTCDLIINQSVANGVTIDWGDGSNQVVSTTGAQKITHTYSNGGEYLITFDVTSGILTLGGTSYSSAFESTNLIKKIEIGNNTQVSDYGIYNLYGLQSITLPNTMTYFKSYYSYLLKAVVVPKSVTSLTYGAFAYNYCMKKVVLPSTLKTMENGIFDSCYTLTKIVLPDSVTSIGNSSLNTYTIKEVVLSKSLTILPDSVMAYCRGVKEIKIPSGVTSIGASAFSSCVALKEVKIPSSVNNIGNRIFETAYGLEIVDFSEHTSIPTLGGTSAFPNKGKRFLIKVPNALLDSWKTASNWSTYANCIVGV